MLMFARNITYRGFALANLLSSVFLYEVIASKKKDTTEAKIGPMQHAGINP